MSVYDSTALAPRLSVEELCRVFAYAREHHGQVHFSDPEGALTEVRRGIWKLLVERLELRRVMSVKAWDELRRQIDDGKDVPEITHESVTAMAEGFRAQLPQMLEAAVGEVFEWLRPPRSEYKRNSEFEVPRRIVISWAVEQWSKIYNSWRLNYHREQHFSAMERVFRALDGKGQTTAGHNSQISDLVRSTPATSARCEGETPYFKFRAWKNGNMHITFAREDLLARFNQIAGGARLKSKVAK